MSAILNATCTRTTYTRKMDYSSYTLERSNEDNEENEGAGPREEDGKTHQSVSKHEANNNNFHYLFVVQCFRFVGMPCV